MCQWMPQGWLSEDEFKSLIKSCTGVFPYVTLWHIAPGQNLMLATTAPGKLDYCQSRERFNDLNRQGDLNSSGITDINTIIAGLLADDKALREYVNGARVNSDLYPWVEFSRFNGTSDDPGILKQLSSFNINFEAIINYSDCPDNKAQILDDMIKRNAVLKKEIEMAE